MTGPGAFPVVGSAPDGAPADLSRALFRRYNRIVARTVLGVLLVAAVLITMQANKSLQGEKDKLAQRMHEQAAVLDAILGRTSEAVRTLQIAAEQRFRTNPHDEAPSLLLRTLVASARNGGLALDTPPPPWTAADVGNLTGQAGPLDPSHLRELDLALSLDPTFAAVKSTNPDVVWSYYLSRRNFINLYPWVPSAQYSFRPTPQQAEFFRLSSSDANPGHDVFWTPSYVDEAGRGLVITCAAPVYEGEKLRATVAMDVTLDRLNRFVAGWQTGGGTLFLVGNGGELLAHPTLVTAAIRAPVAAAAAFPPVLRGDDDLVRKLTTRGLRLRDGYYVYALALDSVPFRLVMVVPRRDLLAGALRDEVLAALLLLGGLGSVLVVTTRLTRREYIGPAYQLVRYIDEESRGAATGIPSVPGPWRPWFETISRVFNAHSQLISIQQELDIARRMQRSIVPSRFPHRPDVEIAARMLPAKEVSGDFYDWFWLGDHRIGVVIADVSGKGIPAALFMAVSRTLLRATAPAAATPAQCLRLTNDLLSRENEATMFVTLFYGIFDTRSGELTYANGGHNAPYLQLPDGAVLRLPRTRGMALGVVDGAAYEDGFTVLAPGTTLFLYTDGVTEAFDGQDCEFGDDRLAGTLATTSGMTVEAGIDSLVRAVNGFAHGVPQSDDITCLALRFVAPSAPSLGPGTAS